MKKHLTKLFTATSFITLSATAVAYDKQDQTVIKQKMAIVETSVKAGQAKPILDVMPPKIFAVIGKEFDVSGEKIKDGMLKIADQQLAKTDLSSLRYTYDIEAAKVLTSETGRDYVIIPTVFTTQGSTVKSHVVALKDDGTWYIVRIESPYQINLLKQAYPDMKHIPLK